MLSAKPLVHSKVRGNRCSECLVTLLNLKWFELPHWLCMVDQHLAVLHQLPLLFPLKLLLLKGKHPLLLFLMKPLGLLIHCTLLCTHFSVETESRHLTKGFASCCQVGYKWLSKDGTVFSGFEFCFHLGLFHFLLHLKQKSNLGMSHTATHPLLSTMPPSEPAHLVVKLLLVLGSPDLRKEVEGLWLCGHRCRPLCHGLELWNSLGSKLALLKVKQEEQKSRLPYVACPTWTATYFITQ